MTIEPFPFRSRPETWAQKAACGLVALALMSLPLAAAASNEEPWPESVTGTAIGIGTGARAQERPAPAGAEAAGETRALGRVDLGSRYYLVDLPEEPAGKPLILALHGEGSSPAEFAAWTGFAEEATARGYVVVLPAGSGAAPDGGRERLSWNAGFCCDPAARQRVDDTGFLSEVITDAVLRFGLDGRQVFMAGFSNGAMMASEFAAGNPKAVRAVAAVAGVMEPPRQGGSEPVPFLLIHGLSDHVVPVAGGPGRGQAGSLRFPPLEAVVKAQLAPLEGETLATTERVIDSRRDGTAVRVTDWLRSGRVILRQMLIEGGGHDWPGARRLLPAPGRTKELQANRAILEFFAAHR